MPDRYFEDFETGQTWTYPAWVLEEESLIEFAKRHDPQPMHTEPDSEAAEAYGGVIASGWQTALDCITPFLDDVMKNTAGLASPGFDTFQWLQPVRAGEPITPRTEILDTSIEIETRSGRSLSWNSAAPTPTARSYGEPSGHFYRHTASRFMTVNSSACPARELFSGNALNSFPPH